MKAKTIRTLKTIAKWTGITVVASAIVAGTGHHFGLWSIQPVYDFIKWNPAEFNWAAYGSAVAYFVGKATLDAIDGRRREYQALQTNNLERKLRSEAEIKERLDRQYEAEIQTQELLRAIINNEVAKNEALAELEIAPDSLKELANSQVIKLKQDGLSITQDVTDTLIDKGLDVVTNIIDKQLKKL
jgi:hypothetical protein